MREIQYKTFSFKTHQKNWRVKRPNVCQFELTFKCGLRCKHCYTDCYNRPEYFKKELSTAKVKLILDKAYQAGVLWVCFTGGDPLTREDFLEIYAYAKTKGFIVTVFTNAYSMNEKIVKYLAKKPPFVVEMTLNGVTQETYEKISQVKGSFVRVMRGIDLMLKADLPLKIKTQVTKDNLRELPEIKKFIEGRGLPFRSSIDLHARLDGNQVPCDSRISPQEALALNGKKDLMKDECGKKQESKSVSGKELLFRCAVGGGDGINLDPYGNMFACNLIRNPSFNILKTDITEATGKLLSLVRSREFKTDSKCKGCNLKESCCSCPGRAFVETGDMEFPIEYHCRLAEKLS